MANLIIESDLAMWLENKSQEEIIKHIADLQQCIREKDGISAWKDGRISYLEKKADTLTSLYARLGFEDISALVPRESKT